VFAGCVFVWKSENAIWAIIVLKFLATTKQHLELVAKKIKLKEKEKKNRTKQK